jgi:hypothetical protein
MGEGEGYDESEEGAEWEKAEMRVTAARGVVAQGHRNCCPRLRDGSIKRRRQRHRNTTTGVFYNITLLITCHVYFFLFSIVFF